MIDALTLVQLALGLFLTGPQDPIPATKAAVVNLADVSDKYQRTKDLEAYFDAQRTQFQKQRDEQKQKIERMTKSIQEELKPGTPEFRERAKQIAMMDAELKWSVEAEGQRLEEGLKGSLRSIYDDIVVVVREIAEERKLDLVVASDKLPDTLPDSPNQLRQQILLQKVLFWNPRIDLTGEVVQRLNSRYQSNPGSASSVPAGAVKTDAGQPLLKPDPAKPDKKP